MQDRLSQNDVTNRVNVEDPARVRDAVLAIYAARYPARTSPRSSASSPTSKRCSKAAIGYLACDTLYHDMRPRWT